MQITDLRNYLTIYQLPEMTNALRTKGQNAMSALAKLDYFYTCYELESFIEAYNGAEELDPASIRQLVALMKKRWDRIQNTNSAYTQDPANPANQLYMQIAGDLENKMGVSKYKILMPTITSLLAKNSKITDFVLSDDNDAIIDVNDCLAQFKKTGKFYHTNKYFDQSELSEAEINRVINHTVNTKNYYNDVVRIRKNNLNNMIDFSLRRLNPNSRKLDVEESTTEVRHHCYPLSNENAIFDQLYKNIDAWHLLSFDELDLLDILHDISSENEPLFIEMISDRENNVNNFVKQVTTFDRLSDMLKMLAENERLQFLSNSKILDSLLDIGRKSTKTAKLKGILKFLELFNDKKAVLNCINADILSLYKDDKKINDILNDDHVPLAEMVIEISDEIVDGELVFSDTESGEKNDQEDDQHEEVNEFIFDDFYYDDVNNYHEEEMAIDEPDIHNEKKEQPAHTEISFDDLASEDLGIFFEGEELTFELEKRAAKKRKVENEATGQISTSVSNNYTATFFPNRKQPHIETAPEETDIHALIKAREWYQRSYPLEVFHYIEKGISALDNGKYDEEYKTSQRNKLYGLVKDTIVLINQCSDLRKMKGHYHKDEYNQINFPGWAEQGINLVKHIYKQPEIAESYVFIINDLIKKLSVSDKLTSAPRI